MAYWHHMMAWILVNIGSVVAFSLTIPSHYLNQCGFIISEVSSIQLRAISQGVLPLLPYIIGSKSFEITLLKLLPHLSRSNELTKENWNENVICRVKGILYQPQCVNKIECVGFSVCSSDEQLTFLEVLDILEDPTAEKPWIFVPPPPYWRHSQLWHGVAAKIQWEEVQQFVRGGVHSWTRNRQAIGIRSQTEGL